MVMVAISITTFKVLLDRAKAAKGNEHPVSNMFCRRDLLVRRDKARKKSSDLDSLVPGHITNDAGSTVSLS